MGEPFPFLVNWYRTRDPWAHGWRVYYQRCLKGR